MSLEGLVSATTVASDRLCKACFDGNYPIELPPEDQMGKFVLESIAKSVDEETRALRFP